MVQWVLPNAVLGLRSRGLICLGVGLMLTACSAPPKDVPAPIEAPSPDVVEVMTTEPELADLPEQEVSPGRRGVFGFLKRNAEEPAPIAVAELDDPAAEAPVAPSLSEEELAALGVVDTDAQEPDDRRRGVLDGLFKRRPEPLATPVEAPEVEVALPQTDAPVAAASSETDPDSAVQVAALDPPDRPRGLRGLFSRNRNSEEPPQAEVILAATPPPPDTDEAILETAPALPEPPTTEADPQPRLRAWPFGRANRPPSPDLALPEFQTSPGSLPFGQVAEACDVKRRDLGKQVAQANGYKLFDTAPESATPRAQYLTGFKDGCPRQFTAALALFGSAQVHEAKRYARSNKTPYSELDLAFERIKNRICGTGTGEYCPRNKAEKLDRDTAFVTVYRGFGDSGLWLEIFLHKGKLVSFQTRTY